MSDQQQQDDAPTMGLMQRLGFFVAPVSFGMIGLDAFLTAPLPIKAGLLLAGGVLAFKSPEIYGELRGEIQKQSSRLTLQAVGARDLPELPPDTMTTTIVAPFAPDGSKWSVRDKMAGRHIQTVEVPIAPTSDRKTGKVIVDHKAPTVSLRDDDEATFSYDDSADLPTVAPRLTPIFPAYKDDETLRLGQVVATGQRFDPHIDSLFGKGMIMAAVQGSGKSMMTGLVIEQAGKCGVPVVVLDHKGEYGGPIADLPFMNVVRAGAPRLKARVTAGAFFDLNTSNADEFVRLVIENRFQAIVHLPSYGTSWVSRAEIVAEVGAALLRYASELLEKDALLVPCLVLVDEAQLYFPQNTNLLSAEAKKNIDVLENLSNAYLALVSNGRSYGFTVVFATQSLTYVAKWLIKSTQVRIYGRHVERNDLDELTKTINPAVATREDMETLPPGHVVAFGLTPKAMIIKVDKRQSEDRSSTPGIARLRQTQRVEEEDNARDKELRRLVRSGDDDAVLAFIAAAQRQKEEEEEQVDSPLQDRASRTYGNSQGNSRRNEKPLATTAATVHQTVKNGLSGNEMGTGNTIIVEPLTLPVEPVPVFFDEGGNVPVGPILGKDDMRFSPEQEEDFIRRYRRKSHIPTVFSEMPNRKGTIGVTKRYYAHAVWIVKNKIGKEVIQ